VTSVKPFMSQENNEDCLLRVLSCCYELWINFHSCTMHSDTIQSFISPTNAQLICFKILKFTLKYTVNASTCFGLTKPSSGSLQSVLR